MPTNLTKHRKRQSKQCPYWIKIGSIVIEELKPRRRWFEMASKESKTNSRRLTSQEIKVLSLYAEGYENEEIASELGLTVSAVHRHKVSLMEKLGHSSISTVIEHVLKKGLINPYEVLESRFSRRGTQSHNV
jgi:DNA-binding NarL/FixJ family response regulator